MSITVNLYYTGENGNARKFAEEMKLSGTVDAIRDEEGNERYEYFFSMDDPETVLLIDRWKDDKNILAGTGALAMKRAYKKAKKRYPEKCEAIESHLKHLTELEKNNCDSIDEAAEPFASVMRELFECGYIKDENERKTLGWLGYNLGRWIYIIDAYDDLEKDAGQKAYNPLISQYGYKGNGDGIGDFRESIREKVNFILTYSLSEAEKVYSLLGIEKNKGILDNILYSGLIARTDRVLRERGRENEKESV